MRKHWIGMAAAVAMTASALLGAVASPASAGPCDPGGIPVVCENSKPGSPATEWDIEGSGDPGLQGYATKFSVNLGETQQFKVKTSTSYTIDIYRLGWYGGNGARKVASVTPVARTQPNCLTDASTGLVDCGNWSVSASWTVPSTAVSGVYIAHLEAPANQDESHITFVVRDDASHSEVLFQTSDSTWQAYNTYGGNDFYTGNPVGRSYKVSYNRPFTTRGESNGRDFLFSNEYPMLQFLERNGYDVSYLGSLDTDRRGPLLLNHEVFVSTGHDEYWSGAQRSNVEAARDAGVNLAFFSGNEVYWRTRWEPSIDGTATDGRTLVCYKETWANAKIDPAPESTATWRDPRFSPPSQGGGLPENALTGTIYKANDTDLPLTVSEREGKLRLWRHTNLTAMVAGQSTALAQHTVGYESDEDLDNGFRPPGLVRLSTTTGPTPEYLVDYGSTVEPGTTTHHLTLYRASSGALVFGAGTVQWAWGLSQNHDGAGAPADPRIQQATVNILADMGALARTPMSGITAAATTSDTQGPVTTITSPTQGSAFGNGAAVTVTGTAADVGGQVAGVEVSTDNGTTWHPATGHATWSYTAYLTGRGTQSIKVRAIDDSANIGAAASVSLNVSCPCSLFGERIPKVPAASDTSSVELGVRLVPQEDGFVSGVRFFKGAGNTGTHTGSLWTSSGGLLATGTFVNETASGWQTLQFSEAVSVTAGQTYVASYRAPNGRYAADAQYFTTSDHRADPLRALGKPSGELNGVYKAGSGFPTSSFGDTNYWVDVLFTVDDATPPIVTSRTPIPGASSVDPAVRPKVTFSRAIDPSTLEFTLTDATQASVPGAVTYDATTRTATFTPGAKLGYASAYTASVRASSVYGVPMAAPSRWDFTTAATDPLPGDCPCSIWTDSDTPATMTDPDPTSVELGVRFTAEVEGEVVGVKFFKGPSNLGTHTGSLWTSGGQLLSQVTFVGESSTGWQTAYFATPVDIAANTTYIVSYRAPQGAYSFTAGGLTAAVDSPPLHTVAHGGVYTFGSGAPTTVSDTNYWVDVLYNPTDAPPTVSSTTPGADATSVQAGTVVTAALTGQVREGTAVLALKDAQGGAVPGASTYDTTRRIINFAPSTPLAAGQRYTATASGAASLSGQQMTPHSWSFTTTSPATCPCTLFESTAVPSRVDAGETQAVNLGVKFSPTVDGFVTGLRFYKSIGNTGTHVGSLWSSTGARLAQVTFTGESGSGWQTAAFAQPVQLEVGQTYVASYHAPNGHYSATQSFFAAAWDNNVLTAPAGQNGVYRYGSDAFPNESYSSTNYWVDPVFQPGAAPDTTAPTVTARTPVDGATSVPESVAPSVTFSEAVDVSTLQLTLRTAGGQSVAGSTSYDATSRTATFTPAAALARGAGYTASVVASDPAGNALTPSSWSFTTAQPAPAPGVCPCGLWDDAAQPAIVTVNDASTVELGLKFTADTDGFITGVQFFKGPKNLGTHTGSLWDTAGNRLATATFGTESSSGWQTVTFANPVAVTAGTTYVASYLTSGFYSATGSGLQAARDVPPLHTPAGAAVYRYGGGFPTAASNANYWVDVVYAYTVPDTTAPVVTGVAVSGSDTTATVTWATNEPATSRVDYGTEPTLGSTATGPSGTDHAVVLSGLLPNTRYHFRVTSADDAGNSTTTPAPPNPPAQYVPPVQPVTHTTAGDFTGTGGYLADSAGGEVTGTPTQGVELGGSTLPSTWTSTALVTGGVTTVAGGLATVSGSRLRTNSTWGSGRSFTASATLGAGQSLGWGSIANGSTSVTASFVMDATGALSARVNDGWFSNTTTAIPGAWAGAPHEYRVDWTSGSVAFLIDGVAVAGATFTPTVNLRVMAVDPTTAAPTLPVSWVRVAPYASSSTYTSAVVDAGAVVGWDTLVPEAAVPSGSTLTIQVRSGTTAVPGAGWTGWSTVSPATNAITRNARYLQYRLQFASSGTRFVTASLQSVRLSFHVL